MAVNLLCQKSWNLHKAWPFIGLREINFVAVPFKLSNPILVAPSPKLLIEPGGKKVIKNWVRTLADGYTSNFRS